VQRESMEVEIKDHCQNYREAEMLSSRKGESRKGKLLTGAVYNLVQTFLLTP